MYQWLQIVINGCDPEGWSHHLLLRKPLGSNKPEDVAAFRCCAPIEKSSLRSLVRASGKRWPIETCFEEAKGLLGMDEYEVRNWTPWYRHMTLVMLAHTFLALTRAQIKKNGPARINNVDGPGSENIADKDQELVNEEYLCGIDFAMVGISKASSGLLYGVP